MRWAGTEVVVTGVGVSGSAAAQALLERGARVTAVDDRDDDLAAARATSLEARGARVRLGTGAATLPEQTTLVVTSPGWPPRSRILAQARDRQIDIWSEVELAWRLRGPDAPPWLCVTGTNGKTTTVQMLAAILTSAGLRTAAVGNIGAPVTQAVTAAEPYDVLALELSSFQLHWTRSMRAEAAVLLNVAPDHLDWYDGSMAAYTADKARIYRRARRAGVYNAADPITERLVREADLAAGCRILAFTMGRPGPGCVGVVDGALVDHATQAGGVELAPVSDISPAAPHTIANALAAAVLARVHGVGPEAVRAGLQQFRPDAHRISFVAANDGVRYVDDSKATNPHAALASLVAFDRVVWIAGGLAKGAHFDDLVAATSDRLRGVVLLGKDQARIAAALARHAPDVPVVVVPGGETDMVMDHVVTAAARISRTGDTVLLAPGCASQDMFADYAARGDAFSAAVRRMRGPPPLDEAR